MTVVVGPKSREFILHQKIACDTSDIFRAAYQKDLKEAVERAISFPEVEEHDFIVYLGWLYTGQVDLRQDSTGKPCTELKGYESISKAFETLVDVYAFGDMIKDASFQNAVVDYARQMLDATHLLPQRTPIHRLYTKLRRPTKLSRLFVDAWVCESLYKAVFADSMPSYPSEFIMEIAQVCVRKRDMILDDRHPVMRSKCFYHEHKDGSEECT